MGAPTRRTLVRRHAVLHVVVFAALFTLAADKAFHALQNDFPTAGTLSFTDITAVAGISDVIGGHGAAFADIDADGLSDLYVTFNEVRLLGFTLNHFYRNVGGAFIQEQVGRGIAAFSGGTHGATWADIDNDGDFDLVLGVTYGSIDQLPAPAPNRIYRNDNGLFVDITPPAMGAYANYTRAILAFDFDRDHDLDVFAVNGELGAGDLTLIPDDRNELYRNDGAAGFTAITAGPLITAPAGQGATDTDYDGDGDMDIIASNRFDSLNVLRNDGSGVFTRVDLPSIGIHHFSALGSTTGDIDNDGDLDLLLVDLVETAVSKVHLYRNNGNGTFSYIVELFPVYGYTAGLADLDNDTDLNLVVPGFNVVLLNDGAGAFSYGPAYPGPVVPPGTLPRDGPDPRTVAFSDVDGDGDNDFAITTKKSRTYLGERGWRVGRGHTACPHSDDGFIRRGAQT